LKCHSAVAVGDPVGAVCYPHSITYTVELMAKLPNEDFFSNTAMTFGEHLEELRVCLTRGLMGLVIGSMLGLLIARPVVDVIQGPLLRALKHHYSELAVQRLRTLYPSADLSQPMMDTVRNSAFVFDEVYLERSEVARIAADTADQADNGAQDGNGSAALRASAPAKTESGDEQASGGGKTAREVAVHQEHVREAQRLDELLKQRLPPPSMDMVKTRIWRPATARLTTLSPHESFMIWVKAGVVTGLLLASPYIFYQIWVFVAAGLYPHEKKYVFIYLPFSVVLFLAGACLAFFFVFGPVLDFLFSFSRMLNIDPDLRISEVISFVLFLPLGFGIAFQLPLVMLFVHRIGLISIEMYLEKWRVAILGIAVISMLLTPSDPYSMLLMAIPLTALYFLGIGLCKWMPRGRNPFAEAYEP